MCVPEHQAGGAGNCVCVPEHHAGGVGNCVCVCLNTRQEGLGMRQERLETRLEFIASLSSFSLTIFVTHSH